MTSKQPIQLLVTDLDNTLYDWITSFVPAFYSMVDVASGLLDTPKEKLLDELQAVHRLYGNSEHPYALLETPTVASQFLGLSRDEKRERLDPAFHAFNRARKNSLRLYDGVRETLEVLRQSGAVVVAHTDAYAGNSLFRLGRLQLTELISRLYAPQYEMKSAMMHIPSGSADVPTHYLRPLPFEERKPNPQVLIDICADHLVLPANTLYVGDSLTRDVYMAERAGVHSAWARYGNDYNRDLWPRLVRVTHWTEQDVLREKNLQAEARNVVPDVELASFSEVLDHFRFSGRVGRGMSESVPR